jgi:para-nitrobenzyl esterase
MTTIVETTTGRLEGVDKHGVLLFAGIPYAAPPVGAARFAPPEVHPGWTGVRDATAFGAVSVQGGNLLGGLFQGTEPDTSEDCLFLNVQTPALDTARRPVMVWIHGGGFTGGSGSTPWYNGARFARHGDVVCVTINYRLGALGFLHLAGHHPDLARSGNNGLLDQMAALRWVRDNIERFGGNPDDVTIFGESAGAMSVTTLLGTPDAAGLFHQAIPQSGAAHNVSSADDATEVADRVLRRLELTDVTELLAAPSEQVFDAQVAVAAAVAKDRVDRGATGGWLPFGPVVDQVTLPQPPLDAIRAGLSAGIPLLTGTNLDEWKLFDLMTRADLDETRLVRRLGRVFTDPETVLATYRSARPEATPDDIWSAIFTDRVFRVPAIRLAEAQARHQPDRTFMYHFTWPTPALDGRLGSCHALEIPFVFDNLDQPGVDFFAGEAAPQSLADAMHRAWLSFVRHHEPGHDGLPTWAPYDETSRATMTFDETCAVTDDPAADERRLWDGVV